MAVTPINVGTTANDGTGDTLRGAFQKVNANEADLQTQINGKATTSHDHAASAITSGTLDEARIPNLDTSKLTSGTLGVARGGTGIASYTNNNYIRASGSASLEQRTPSQVLGDIGAAAFSHNHDDRYYTEDEIDDMIADAGGGDMTKAVYDSEDDGVVNAARAVPWSGVTDKPSTFPPDSHNHDVAAITSGTLGVARGGTGIASYTTNNYVRASGSTSLEQRTPSQVLSDISATPTSRTISSGTGLDGGGDLSANRTLSLSSGTQTSLGKADTAVQPADVANVSRVVVHGATAGTARPSGALHVIWKGSVEPENAQPGDFWYDTTGDA